MKIMQKIITIVLVMFMVLGLSFGISAAEFVLSHGTHTAEESLIGQAGRKFNELVEEMSDGEIQMNYYPGGQFGGAIAHMEQTMEGAIDMNTDVVEWYGNFNKDFSIFGWGFAFRDVEHFNKFIASERFDQMKQELIEETDLRILNVVPTEPRVFFSRQPIENVDDIQGITMRVPEIEAYLKVWEGLGTNPARIPWGDLYTSLRTGVVDAAEGPITLSYEDRLHEGAPNVYLTRHIINSVSFVINNDTYQSMPEEFQDIIDEAAVLAGDWAMEEGIAMTEEVIEKYKEDGATVSEIDVTEFQEILIEAAIGAEEDGLWSEGLYEEVQAIE